MAEAEPRRARFRRRAKSFTEERRKEIVNRVLGFYDRDIGDRAQSREIRVQREAKLRGWVEDTDYPWPGASNIPLTDIAEKSLKTQDSIHNAIMASVPVVPAMGVNDADRERQQQIDSLIHHQIFVDQPGEAILGEAEQAFTDDGCYTILVVWIDEKHEVERTSLFPPVPEGASPAEFFEQALLTQFPGQLMAEPRSDEGWDWIVTVSDPDDERGEATKKIEVGFYTQRDTMQIEMSWREKLQGYNGPRMLPKDYDDVLYPPRSANLQPPGPANPRGAPHVIFRDRPTLDEVRGLVRNGFYDLAKAEDVDSMEVTGGYPEDDDREQLRDNFEGVQESQPDVRQRQHRRVTRLLCFDRYDIDGDGLAEDVVWWVVRETGTLLRARRLDEFFPCLPPRRPIAEGSFLPVRGRRDGISIVELLEGLHDAQKALMDQSIDSGNLANMPFWAYRPMQSGLVPEDLMLQPGMGIPLNDPSRDLVIHTLGNSQNAAAALNFMTYIEQRQERVSMIGDIEMGRVPPGRSAALRTAGGMAQLAARGAARPERIFRRFMDGMRQLYEIIHTYNQRFLTEPKQVRLIGFKRPEERPYITVAPREDLIGNFQFSFRSEGLLDTGGQVESLGMYGQLVVQNPLMIQAGLVTPEGVYRWAKRLGERLGLDPDEMLQAPSPDAQRVRMTAEEAIGQISNNLMPEGVPAEFGGWIEHIQKLQAFTETDEIGVLSEQQISQLLLPYMQHAGTQAIQQQQRMQMAQAAAQGQQGAGNGQGGPPSSGGAPNTGPPPISGNNELIDETMPSAGGGGQQ